MNKRRKYFGKGGMSHHVEMMISFVLFIMFVFFVLIFIRPHDNNYLSGSVVYGAHYNFVENAKENVLTVFVNVSNFTDVNPASCASIVVPEALVSSAYNNSIVRIAKSGEDVNSNYDETSNIIGIMRNNNGSYYVSLTNSLEEDDLSSCVNTNAYNYSFGSIYEEEVLTVKKLYAMSREYDNDYEGLKLKLGIPGVYDFSIVSDVVLMERDRGSALEVLARDYIEKVFYEDGSFKYERFSIRVWR